MRHFSVRRRGTRDPVRRDPITHFGALSGDKTRHSPPVGFPCTNSDNSQLASKPSLQFGQVANSPPARAAPCRPELDNIHLAPRQIVSGWAVNPLGHCDRWGWVADFQDGALPEGKMRD